MVKSKKKYVPDRGDIVWLDFNPQAGHEQRGRRPALTVSYQEYNAKIGLGLFCPITSKVKGYPFEVEVGGKSIDGCVLSDQVKSLDWTVRNIGYIEKLDEEKLNEVIGNIVILMKK
ncbi:MAG: endoribonuclease MazF [Candidatus Competibacteraceae bacterium]|nr:endoribonuclease MazF [Candidatus Competibacteraceae bacterium]